MKYEVVPNSCRICLRKCKKLRSIFKPLEEGDEPPNEMLKLITGITMEEPQADDLPKNICKGCELSLNLAFQFRSKALKSQRIIEVYCSHKMLKENEDIRRNVTDPFCELKDEMSAIVEVKQEETARTEVLERIVLKMDESNDNCTTYDMKVVELEMPFSDEAKIEYLEDDSVDDDFDAAYSSTDEMPLSSVQQQQHEISPKTTSDVNVDVEESEVNVESIEELKKELQSLEKLLETNQPAHKSCLTETQPLKKRAKRGRKPKYDIEELKQRLINSEKFTVVEVKSKSPGAAPTLKLVTKKSPKPKVNDESGHICDICGNIYTKRGRMMEHRRRHDKELRFACELCDKRFHLREKLRKHMFSHSGGKPYQCSFCSRTFFYESVKKAHEAVHKGVKPYICEVCNKAFAYSHALKKHKLIHADIKLYHCEYCDKDFRLQHHMKQHEETKLHQNAVKSIEAVRNADE